MNPSCPTSRLPVTLTLYGEYDRVNPEQTRKDKQEIAPFGELNPFNPFFKNNMGLGFGVSGLGCSVPSLTITLKYPSFSRYSISTGECLNDAHNVRVCFGSMERSGSGFGI